MQSPRFVPIEIWLPTERPRQNEQLCGQDHVACIVCARVLLGPDLALDDDGDVRAASTEESEQGIPANRGSMTPRYDRGPGVVR